MKDPEVTLYTLLCNLRRILLDAADKKDQQHLADLVTTFDQLLEASYQETPSQVVEVLQTMTDFARYSIMGVGWKIDLPSEAEIKASIG